MTDMSFQIEMMHIKVLQSMHTSLNKNDNILNCETLTKIFLNRTYFVNAEREGTMLHLSPKFYNYSLA